jgi:hypothetical protein
MVRFDAHHQYYDHQGPIAADDDADIEIYESDSEDEDDSGSAPMVTDAQPNHPLQIAQGYPMSEDEPWPGIEDQVQRPDGENIDPTGGGSEADEADDNHSSQPSEYPSTQIIKRDEDEEDDFRIHEDL